jgi:hypothetical protein
LVGGKALHPATVAGGVWHAVLVMRCFWRFVIAVSLPAVVILATSARGQEAAPQAAPEPAPAEQPTSRAADPRESICLMIEAAARAYDLPVEFFARVIWQESRFAPNLVGPLTRSGERAQGIAQFMPGTAAERRLLDPFDPVQALPKSAEFLRELRDQFGNLGLAAAAYNAGPQRLRDFLAGTRTLPAETRNYVLAITGLSVDEWAKGPKGNPSGAGTRRPPAATSCGELTALLRGAPNPFVEQLEQRVKLVAASAWGVQLSAGFSRDRALASFANLSKRYAVVLEGHDPTIFSTTLRSRGTRPFYQVRLGAETRASADGLCGKIRRAGGACLVLRNSGAAS